MKTISLMLFLMCTGCKTINVTVISNASVEILVDQRGSDVTSDLKAKLK